LLHLSVPFFFPFSPLFLRAVKWSPQTELRDLGECCYYCPQWGENEICNHQTHSLGSKYTKNVFVAEMQGTCLVAANVVLFLLNEI